MPEWAPGVLADRLAKVTVLGEKNLTKGLYLIAVAVEAKAKAELSRTSHPYGTPSPAAHGSPPALVSGTGRRSIGHEYMPVGFAHQVMKIGTIAGVYPPRFRPGGPRRRSTPSSRYLWYQENLPRFDHPFLRPAFESVIHDDSVRLWLTAFRAWSL